MSQFENLKLANQLCFALYAATNAITRSYRGRLSRVGLTYPQYLVMMVLWEKDGVSIKEISKQLHLDPATITPLVKRLEAANLLRRSRNEMDERVVNVYLTITGRNIQSEVAEMQKAVACQTGLEESEFIELRSTLHHLVETLSQNQPDAEEDDACALPR